MLGKNTCRSLTREVMEKRMSNVYRRRTDHHGENGYVSFAVGLNEFSNISCRNTQAILIYKCAVWVCHEYLLGCLRARQVYICF